MARIALIAHDACKEQMVAWVGKHLNKMMSFSLVATAATGEKIATAFPQLSIACVKSGPMGGDQQIGAMIADGHVDALIFFIDPMTAMPHDVDVKALTRLAVLYDLHFACNVRTAEAILEHITLGK